MFDSEPNARWPRSCALFLRGAVRKLMPCGFKRRSHDRPPLCLSRVLAPLLTDLSTLVFLFLCTFFCISLSPRPSYFHSNRTSRSSRSGEAEWLSSPSSAPRLNGHSLGPVSARPPYVQADIDTPTLSRPERDCSPDHGCYCLRAGEQSIKQAGIMTN